jgi:hypothetical protein
MYLGPGTYIQLCAEAQAPMEGDEPYGCQTGRLSIGVLRTTSLPLLKVTGQQHRSWGEKKTKTFPKDTVFLLSEMSKGGF